MHAYPSGGSAYIVARDNIGEFAAQVAGASLPELAALFGQTSTSRT